MYVLLKNFLSKYYNILFIVLYEYYNKFLNLYLQVETVIDKSRADPPTDAAEVNKEENSNFGGKSPSKVTFSEEQENTTNNTNDNNDLSVRATGYRVSYMDYSAATYITS